VARVELLDRVASANLASKTTDSIWKNPADLLGGFFRLLATTLGEVGFAKQVCPSIAFPRGGRSF
jgi:hypothetical protein